MTEVLLKELSNSDIDWLTTVGHQTEMAAGTVLVERGKLAEAMHMVIDGALSVSIPQNDMAEWELNRLGSGELVGEMTFVGQRLPVITIKTLERSLILSIPRSQVAAKLQQDVRFAAHFYRAVAILLSDRLRRINTRLESINYNPEEPLKKGLFVLGELKDSDVNWMMSVGVKEKIPAGQVLVQQGRPIDALYILLEGTAGVSVCHAKISPLLRVFATKDGGSGATKQELDRLTSGEIVGEMSFLENEQAYITIKSLEDCLVLSIPREQLVAKLQMDVRFAARFYRAIATVIEGRLRSTILRMTSGDRAYRISEMLDEEVETEDEIDIEALDSTAIAGARFGWILSQLRN